MNSVIVAATNGTCVRRFADIARCRWSVRDVSDLHCVVADGDNHVIINLDDSIACDYDEEEMLCVRSVVPNPAFFMFEFSDFAFGKEVLSRLVDGADVAVDDDHGHVMRGTEFCRRLRDEGGFDWR